MNLKSAEGRSLGQPTLVALVLLACAGTLALALDGLSYWHDVRFLFATTQFPFPELLEGRFNPHEAWGIVDETATSGFYASKVLHLWILHLLFSVVDPASGGLSVAVALSVLAMVASAAGVAAVVVRVTGAGGLRGAAILSFIFLPVVPYLAGKQLAEVTSLAVSVWALAPAWAGLQTTKSNAAWRRGALAAVLLLFGALLRLDSLFGPVAFLLAAVALAEDGPPRLRALGFAAGVLTTVGVAYGFVMLLLGVSPTAFSGYAMELLGAPSRPAALSVLAIGTFGGVAYAFAALAWLSPRRRAAALFLLWWLIAWLPSILMTASFGVEPRYLAQGAPPRCRPGDPRYRGHLVTNPYELVRSSVHPRNRGHSCYELAGYPGHALRGR